MRRTRVSNPYREFISRAHGRLPSGRRERVHVSNPYREFISRALQYVIGMDYGYLRFKPLSGIHLARTLIKGRTYKIVETTFQTPIGNSSRAHRSGRNVTTIVRMFQTPIGNSSRAHARKTGSFARGNVCFKPLSGIHLARTGVLLTLWQPKSEFQTPIGNSSRAHLTETAVLVAAGVRFKPLSGIHLARTSGYAALPQNQFAFQTPIGNSSRAHSTWQQQAGHGR